MRAMDWWRALFLIPIGLLILASAFADAASARGPEFKAILNKWFIGRCHMDYCDRHLITSVQELGTHPDGYGVLILVRSIDRFEEYDKNIGYVGKPIKVEKSNGSQTVFCSKRKPGVIFRGDDNKWIFRPLKPGEPAAEFGFNLSSYRWYYASCHNTTKHIDTKIAKRLGYEFIDGELEDDIELRDPTDVLRWNAEYFSE
jgi:hypothetical protein